MQSKPGDKRVLVARGLVGSEQQQQFITLPDPKSGQPASYLLAGGCLQELNWYKQQYSSWLVGNSVVKDGGVFIATPVDPLLVLLPLLEQARAAQNVFQDIEQILSTAASSSAALLLPLLGSGEQLGCLCDVKWVGGQGYYRLNDALVVAWLKLKVEQAMSAMRTSPAAAFSGMDDLSLTAYAAGLVGEYLGQHWLDKLVAALNLPDELPALPAHVPPQPDSDVKPTEKKPRMDPKEAAKLKAAESRQATKVAKLAKEASNMRKLSSFFKPAAAKPASAK